MNAKSPEDAAELFCKGYEGYTIASGIAQRKKAARDLYNKYKGKYQNAAIAKVSPVQQSSSFIDTLKNAGIGGPDESDEYDVNVINRASGNPPARGYLPGIDAIGGPDEQESQLNLSQYITRQNKIQNSRTIQSNKIGKSTSSTGRFTSIGGKQTSPINDDMFTANSTTTGSTDLSNVISMMGQIINELARISQNTGSSSNLLESLNEKDFVDQGLRDSLNALGNTRKKSTKNRSSGSTTRAVASMARP